MLSLSRQADQDATFLLATSSRAPASRPEDTTVVRFPCECPLCACCRSMFQFPPAVITEQPPRSTSESSVRPGFTRGEKNCFSSGQHQLAGRRRGEEGVLRERERPREREREREKRCKWVGGREWGSAWIKMQPDAQLFVILLSPTPSRTD